MTLKEKTQDVEIGKGMSDRLEEIADEFVIGFVSWLTNENSKYAVLYGNQKKRFADFENEYTIEELLKIYKKL